MADPKQVRFDPSAPYQGLIAIGGAAAAPGSPRPRAVLVCIDGERDYQAAVSPTGFDAIIALGDLPPGDHSVSLKVVGARAGEYYAPAARLTFAVRPAVTPTAAPATSSSRAVAKSSIGSGPSGAAR